MEIIKLFFSMVKIVVFVTASFFCVNDNNDFCYRELWNKIYFDSFFYHCYEKILNFMIFMEICTLFILRYKSHPMKNSF